MKTTLRKQKLRKGGRKPSRKYRQRRTRKRAQSRQRKQLGGASSYDEVVEMTLDPLDPTSPTVAVRKVTADEEIMEN